MNRVFLMIRIVRGVYHLPTQSTVLLLKLYKRWLSPYLAPACRFYPTCSVYAIEVYQEFGFIRGSWYTLKRLLKCHPFHPGGIDMPRSRTSDSSNG